jgi:hypothetical protein
MGCFYCDAECYMFCTNGHGHCGCHAHAGQRCPIIELAQGQTCGAMIEDLMNKTFVEPVADAGRAAVEAAGNIGRAGGALAKTVGGVAASMVTPDAATMAAMGDMHDATIRQGGVGALFVAMIAFIDGILIGPLIAAHFTEQIMTCAPFAMVIAFVLIVRPLFARRQARDDQPKQGLDGLACGSRLRPDWLGGGALWLVPHRGVVDEHPVVR